MMYTQNENDGKKNHTRPYIYIYVYLDRVGKKHRRFRFHCVRVMTNNRDGRIRFWLPFMYNNVIGLQRFRTFIRDIAKPATKLTFWFSRFQTSRCDTPLLTFRTAQNVSRKHATIPRDI